ncbi:hypothetical protein GCM10010472_49000 [Pseudonocardia halophobica]|uniref:DUF4386 domain-containing protein n=1 Tax=Pseudonocardia halophobica TaxID=29401 RepID=A0A9W6UF66_9PSEU|nr:DUF4386 domain-containing protein [Pseudonocardia halophobica]GLL15337.1 hypothetical protein GCM10017577_64870 [Pseudonocardia halophobica]
MTMTATRPARTRPDRQGGPPLLVPALAFAALTVAGAVLGSSGPRPGTGAEATLVWTAAHGTLMSVGAALLLGSAFPLVVYAATAVWRLQRLGVTAPGPLMGFAGAVLAAGSLGVSALVGWVAAQTAGLGDAALARALVWLWFAAGGIGFAAPLGLLLLGLGVPALIRRLVPRWLAWAALVIGGLAVLSTFALITDALYPLIPVGRFGGVLVLVAFAVALPATRNPEPAR